MLPTDERDWLRIVFFGCGYAALGNGPIFFSGRFGAWTARFVFVVDMEVLLSVTVMGKTRSQTVPANRKVDKGVLMTRNELACKANLTETKLLLTTQEKQRFNVKDC